MNACACGCSALAQRRFVHGHNSRRIRYRVDANGCWIWLGRRTGDGYGRCSSGTEPNRRDVHAHRFVYERAKGPIPPGLQLDHLCRNRLCVNPEHLEPVSLTENVRRSAATKLTLEDARAIRQSPLSERAIAKQYGVTHGNVHAIRIDRTWREEAPAALSRSGPDKEERTLMATRTLTTRKADRERAEAAGYAAINLSVSRREAMNAAKRLDSLGETEAFRRVQTAICSLDDAKLVAGL